MRFRCPCCRRQIEPFEESFEHDAQTEAIYSEDNGKFISLSVDRGNADDSAAEMQEVIVDNAGERTSVKNESISETSGLLYNFLVYHFSLNGSAL